MESLKIKAIFKLKNGSFSLTGLLKGNTVNIKNFGGWEWDEPVASVYNFETNQYIGLAINGRMLFK